MNWICPAQKWRPFCRDLNVARTPLSNNRLYNVCALICCALLVVFIISQWIYVIYLSIFFRVASIAMRRFPQCQETAQRIQHNKTTEQNTTNHETNSWNIFLNSLQASIKFPAGPLFPKRTDVLSQDPVKFRSHEIPVSTFPIALTFDGYIGSSAAEIPVKFQSDTITIAPNWIAAQGNLSTSPSALQYDTYVPNDNLFLNMSSTMLRAVLKKQIQSFGKKNILVLHCFFKAHETLAHRVIFHN